MLHPTFRTLSDFADGVLDSTRSRRVARHLERCVQCREKLWSIRALDAAAQEIPVPAMPADLLQRTLARRTAGEEVILPRVEDEAPASHDARKPWRAAAIAAAVLLAASTLLWRSTDRLEAEASELRFTPSQPQPGAHVHVEYRATSQLASHDVLVLRARYRHAGAGLDVTQQPVATLRRTRDRTFAGAFTLPDSIVYAVFAVEDTAATTVDANAERWQLLVHDETGRPHIEALHEQYHDARMRNRTVARAAAVEMMRLYPQDTRAWLPYFLQLVENEPRNVRDSIAAVMRARLPAQLAHADSTSYRDVEKVVWYADHIQDTAAERVWRDRLIRLFPDSSAAKQQRALALVAAPPASRAEFWNAAERLRQESGPERQQQLLFSALETARAWGDAEQIERWGERWLALDTTSRAEVLNAYVTVPELQERAMQLLRARLRDTHVYPDFYRPLFQTRAAFDANRAEWRADYYTRLGRILMQRGDTAAALDTLARAADTKWDPALFRTVAAYRLAAGDTLAALPLLARVALDPETTPAYADSVRARFRGRFTAAQWSQWTIDAARQLERHVMVFATNRPVQGSFTLAAPDGTQRTVNPVHDTETVVAFWCRECPPSFVQLPALNQLAQQLEQRNVRFITITDEDPRSARLTQFIERHDYRFPYFGDPDREAARALGGPSYPRYVVIDRDGRIRFDGHRAEAVLRQLLVLRGLPGRHVAALTGISN